MGFTLPTCPDLRDHFTFDSSIDLRLMQPRAALDLGEVDASDFDQERRDQASEMVWGDLIGSVPKTADFVVAGGDAAFKSTLVDQNVLSGRIDGSRLGVSDRYQDLALICAMSDLWGPHWKNTSCGYMVCTCWTGSDYWAVPCMCALHHHRSATEPNCIAPC